MINYINNTKNKTLLKLSEFSLLLLELKKKNFEKMLKKHWEICLTVDVNREYEICFDKNKEFFYFLETDMPFKFNYFILAKIVDSLCNNYKLQYVIRELAKTEFQSQSLVNLFSKNTVKNSIFLRWLFSLWIELFYQYILNYTAYILTSRLFCDWHNVEIQRFGNFLLFINKDMKILKLYDYTSQIWQCKDYIANKNKITHKILKLNGKSSGISCLYYGINFSLENKTNKDNRKVYFQNRLKFKKKLNLFAKRKYTKIVKNVIESNKSNLQANIIYKINILIKSWLRYWNIFLIKNDYQLLNQLFHKALWQWAIFRHTKKSAIWIKQRYWYKFQDGTYFSKCLCI